MRFKGAIFDLDGTLLDSMKIWDSLGADYLRLKGCIPREDLNEALKTMSLLQSAKYFREAYHVADSEEDIIKQVDRLIETKYRETIPLKASVKSFLSKLKRNNVRMCIATATDRHLAEAALKRLGIMDYFTGIMACTEAGIGKDNPDLYIGALNLIGTTLEETIVFEDALHAIISAKKAGFFVIGVHDASADSDKKKIMAAADCYINSFDEWEMEER